MSKRHRQPKPGPSAPPQVPEGSWSRWALPGLAAAAALAYANSLPGILFWDCEVLILDNVFLRSFRHLAKIFSTSEMAGGGSVSNYWRPIPVTLLLLQYQLWGPSPLGYHAVNILLHAACACLLFLLLRTLLKGKVPEWASLLAALLFAVHPVHNETVNYVGHLNSLSVFFFGMLALLLYAKGRRRLSLLPWTVCLLSKEEGVVFFLLFALHDLWLAEETVSLRERVRGLLRLWPHALILAAYVVLHVTVFNFLRLPISQFGAQKGAYAGLGLRLLTFAKALAVYFRLLVVPTGLHFDRDMAPVASWTDGRAWLCVGLDAAVLCALWRLARGSREARYGLSWFLAGLLPYAGLLPFNNILAEHFLYLPSAGLCLALAALLSARRAAVAVVLGFAVLVMPQGWRRNRDWQDAVRLYETTLAGNPGSFRAANNLGAEYYRKGDLDGARRAFEASLQANAIYAPALNNVGAVVEAEGRIPESLAWYQRAEAADPSYALAHKNAAGVLLKLGDLPSSERAAREALRIHPGYADAWSILAMTCFRQRKLRDSAEAFAQAAALAPSPQAYVNLALVFETMGLKAEALQARAQAAGLAGRGR